MQFWIMDFKSWGIKQKPYQKYCNSPKKNPDPLNVFFEHKDIPRRGIFLLKGS